LARPCFINKVQIIFPRSQEDYQPVKMGASLQRKFSGEATVFADAAQAVWFGNYQHNAPSGWKESANASGDYRYLNTHTQTANTLYDGSTPLMNIFPETSPSKTAFSGVDWSPQKVMPSGGWGPVYDPNQRGGRYSVVVPNSSDHSYVSQGPNTINPGFDFYRQEYGPFVRGCTADELWDTTLVKAITKQGSSAEWSTRQQPLGHWFRNPQDFCLTNTAQDVFNGALFVFSGTGLLQKLTNDNTGKLALTDTTVQKYLYPINYSDTSQNPILEITSFTSLTDFLLNQFSVYLTSGDKASDYAYSDYLVKESYYFAPHYNQYSTHEVTSNGDLCPSQTDLAQKVVRQEFGQGRYFGFTCGSFLNDPVGNHRYTRGLGNKVRIYSLRLCTQLFSFTSNLGTIVDSTATTPATFHKRYEAGIAVECGIDNHGLKYTQDEYSGSDTVKPYPTVPGSVETVFIDPVSGTPLDRTDTLMTNNTEAFNYAASKLSLGTFDESQPVSLTAEMEDDVDLGEYTFYLKASSKTPLRRFMELQLDVVNI